MAILVKDVMSRPYYSIRIDKTVKEALDEMERIGVNKIIIENIDGTLRCATDFWRLKLVDSNLKIEDAINQKPYVFTKTGFVYEDQEIEEIIPQLSEKDLLAVQDYHGWKAGVISRSDLSRIK